MPKARVPLGGETILMHALRGIVASGVAQQVCVALPAGDGALRQMCEDFKEELADGGPLLTLVDGGATRADSVRSALAALEDGTQAVLVHDAARALTPESVFHRVVDSLAAGALAVIPVIPVVDTVKTVEATVATTSTSRRRSSSARPPGKSSAPCRLRRALTWPP